MGNESSKKRDCTGGASADGRAAMDSTASFCGSGITTTVAQPMEAGDAAACMTTMDHPDGDSSPDTSDLKEPQDVVVVEPSNTLMEQATGMHVMTNPPSTPDSESAGDKGSESAGDKGAGTSLTPYVPSNPIEREMASLVEQQILSLIDKTKEKKVKLSQLPQLFQSTYSTCIPLKPLGHKKLKGLLNTLPKVKIRGHSGSECVCRAAGEDSLLLVADPQSTPMKQTTSMPTMHTLPSASASAGFEDRDEGTATQFISDVSSHSMEREMSSLLECQILSLIDESNEKKVSLTQMHTLFQSTYSTPVPYKALGHTKLKGLLDKLPALAVRGQPSTGNEYVCRAGEGPGEALPTTQAFLENGDSSHPSHQGTPLPSQTTTAICINSVQSEGDMKSLILSASRGLTSTKMHRKILELLDDIPEGVTCSRILKEVSGLSYYIQSRAKDDGCDFYSPVVFLRGCQGVRHKFVDGRNMFFADADYHVDATAQSTEDNLGSENNTNTVEDSEFVRCADEHAKGDMPMTSNVSDNGVSSLARDPDESVPPEDTVGFARSTSSLQGLAGHKSIIVSASKDSPRTKLHREILELLARNPEGVTCSRVMRDVKGLQEFLQSHCDEAGCDFMSAANVLRGWRGVHHKVVDGQDMFLVDCGYKEDAPRQSAEGDLGPDLNARTADGAAAVVFLRFLEDNFRKRPWPATAKELKQFLIQLGASPLSSFTMWLKSGFSEELSIGKRRREAVRRIIFQLKNMDCLNGTNNCFVWNFKAVSNVLEHRESPPTIQRPDCCLEADALSALEGASTLFIDTVEKMDRVKVLFPFDPRKNTSSTEERHVVAIDCEGVPEELFLVQVGTDTKTYVFDCVKLGALEVCEALAPLLLDSGVTKLFHDLHNDAVALSQIGGVEQLCGTLDTQLAMELLTGNLHIGFNHMLQQLGQGQHPLKELMKRKMGNGSLFAQRPLPPDVLEYAALDVDLLIKAKECIFAALGGMASSVQRASDTRARLAPSTGGARQICFDVANSYAMASLELLQEQRPDDMLTPLPLKVSDETAILLDLLPRDLREALTGRTSSLSDIVLDKGRPPLAWIRGERCFLGEENRMVNQDDIDAIVRELGGFGDDNRAGLEKQLHRVSAIRNRQLDVIGLTMRVGRHVDGNAMIISDLLFSDYTKSILFLGEPGSGKTTVVREVTRLLAERFNVCIVDTSNEIAGDGDIPHPCVGFARRMMVTNLDKQSSVMIECVQNHTPEVMVIDEIGRTTEVEAARTCKQRGVRLVASAHGDLRKLIKNPKLRGLVGGVETVILGDAQAKVESKKTGQMEKGIKKLKSQRAGSPTFDVIVELKRGIHDEWRIIMDVGSAVDRVLEGQNILAQRRIRDPITGCLAFQLEQA